MTKGISILISHAVFIAIGIVALIIISTMLWGVYDSIIKEEIRKDLAKISQTLSGEITKLYALKDSPANPEANKSALLGESSLSLQEKAGGRQYTIELSQSGKITITNISEGNASKYGSQIIAFSTNPLVRVNTSLYNINAGLQGSGTGGKPFALRYYRLNFNGTIEDRIVLNDDLIAGGENAG